jgi:hypothetical protein
VYEVRRPAYLSAIVYIGTLYRGLLLHVLQVRLQRLAPGDLVWKSRDPALESRLMDSYESVSSTTARKLPVQVCFQCAGACSNSNCC